MTSQNQLNPAPPSRDSTILVFILVGLLGLLLLGIGIVVGVLIFTPKASAPVQTPIPAPTIPVTPVPEGAPVATAKHQAYVRSGPGVQYPAYGIAQAGQKAQIVGVSSDKQWWAVSLPTQYSSTGMGWVAKADVTVSNTQNIPPVPAPTLPPTVSFPPPATNDPTAVALTTIYVRSGPGTSYPAYGLGQPGQSALVTGKSTDGQWWQVAIPTQYSSTGRGWVSAAYVLTYNTQYVPVIPYP
jgi:uncharacterized protein YraI